MSYYEGNPLASGVILSIRGDTLLFSTEPKDSIDELFDRKNEIEKFKANINERKGNGRNIRDVKKQYGMDFKWNSTMEKHSWKRASSQNGSTNVRSSSR